MARLTKEQKQKLYDLYVYTPHDKAFVECILRLDELDEPAVDAMRVSQEATIEHLRAALKREKTFTQNELIKALTLAYDERDEARVKLAEAERERDDARKQNEKRRGRDR